MKKLEFEQNKKIFVLLITLIAIFSVSIGTTFAYLTSETYKKNTVNAAVNEVEVTEEFEAPKQQDNTPYKKTVSIKNNSDVSCFVRARVIFSVSDIENIAKFTNSDNPSTITDWYNAKPGSADSYSAHLPAGWVYNDTDGYYYYNEPIAPGGNTPTLNDGVNGSTNTTYNAEYCTAPLFDSIKLSNITEPVTENLHVNVTAYAIQSTGVETSPNKENLTRVYDTYIANKNEKAEFVISDANHHNKYDIP